MKQPPLKPLYYRSYKDYIPLDHFIGPNKSKSKVKHVNNEKNKELKELIKIIAKGSKKTQKNIVKKIEDKKEELGFFVNDIAAAHIIAKDLKVKLPTAEFAEETEDKPEWVRIANINTETGELKQNQKYKGELDGLYNPINLSYFRQVIDKTNHWEIIGESESNRTDQGSGIFLRLSKSGQAVIFFIGETVYSIPVGVFESGNEFIGISKRNE